MSQACIAGYPLVEIYEDYFASYDGEIYSAKRKGLKKLKGGIDKDGYRKLIICNNGKRLHKRLHVLIANAFLGNQPEGTVVCHIDGDLKNNRADNLKYATQKENIADKIKHGTVINGERSPTAKLKKSQVIKIYKSKKPSGKIAKEYGVSKGAIDGIRSGRNWKHLTKELDEFTGGVF